MKKFKCVSTLVLAMSIMLNAAALAVNVPLYGYGNGYRVQFQNADEYENVPYTAGTIASSGCVPAALCNVLYQLGEADVSVQEMCSEAVNFGATSYNGTWVQDMLDAAAEKYHYTVYYTKSTDMLREHLENGNCAIISCPGNDSLFSEFPHSIAAVGIEGDSIIVLESAWRSDFYRQREAEGRLTVFGDGVLKVPLSQIKSASEGYESGVYSLITWDVRTAAQNFAAPFVDVLDRDWYYDAVVADYQQGFMVGTSGQTFSPSKFLSRAEAIQLIYQYNKQTNEMSGIANSAVAYTDVPQNAWYKTALQWAEINGITHGMSSTSFAPDIAVTREQFTAMLYRYSLAANQEEAVSENARNFVDSDKVSAFAESAISWAVKNQIVNGNDKRQLLPQDDTIRAEAAQMIQQYFQYSKN